jgi:hypothetical protein
MPMSIDPISTTTTTQQQQAAAVQQHRHGHHHGHGHKKVDDTQEADSTTAEREPKGTLVDVDA